MSVDQRPEPPVHPSRVPAPIKGLREKLGLTGTVKDLSPQTQMAVVLARVRPDMHIYAGTVPYAEVQRRRAANRRAKASRKANRGAR